MSLLHPSLASVKTNPIRLATEQDKENLKAFFISLALSGPDMTPGEKLKKRVAEQIEVYLAGKNEIMLAEDDNQKIVTAVCYDLSEIENKQLQLSAICGHDYSENLTDMLMHEVFGRGAQLGAKKMFVDAMEPLTGLCEKFGFREVEQETNPNATVTMMRILL